MGSGMSSDLLDSAAGTYVASSINKSLLMPDPRFRSYEDTARAKGAVSIWRAPIDELRRLLLHYPAVAWEFVSLLALRQRQMERRLESFAFKRTEARLAETFRELSGGFATRCEHGFGQHVRLTQQELADLVGASRPVVSTILNKLRDKGVLGYNREYVCVRGIEAIAKLIES